MEWPAESLPYSWSNPEIQKYPESLVYCHVKNLLLHANQSSERQYVIIQYIIRNCLLDLWVILYTCELVG